MVNRLLVDSFTKRAGRRAWAVLAAILAGCGGSSPDFDSVQFEHKLDGWRPTELRSAELRSAEPGARTETRSLLNPVHPDGQPATPPAEVRPNGSPSTGRQSSGQSAAQQPPAAPAPESTSVFAEYPPTAPPAEEPPGVAPLSSSQDIPTGWTGAVIYSQPGCRPCEREINAIRNRPPWTVGCGSAGFRDKSHFVVIVLTLAEQFAARGLSGTPTTVYFRAGRETRRVTGFRDSQADLAAILAAHPSVNPASVRAELEPAGPPTVTESWTLTELSSGPWVAGGFGICLAGCPCAPVRACGPVCACGPACPCGPGCACGPGCGCRR